MTHHILCMTHHLSMTHRMKEVVFGFGSETGMGASIVEEVYAVVVDALPDIETDLPDGFDTIGDALFEKNKTGNEILLILSCSSTGSGELPVNARQFEAKLKSSTLSNVCYMMLCLGDSNYANYMGGPVTLDAALANAGARKIVPNVYADDADKDGFADATDNFIESAADKVTKWIDGDYDNVVIDHDPIPKTNQDRITDEAHLRYAEILNFIKSNHVTTETLKIPKMPEPIFKINRKSADEPEIGKYEKFEQIQNGDIFDPINSSVYNCEVAAVRKLTGTNAGKTCWEMTFRHNETDRASDNNRELRSGDCIAIYTANDDHEVETVLKVIGGDGTVCNSGDRRPGWIGEVNSLRNLLKFDFELRSPVTKAMIGNMAKFTADPTTKATLQQYIAREGRQAFTELLNRQVTFIHLLDAFPQLQLDLSILTYLRRLQRRWYSIANYVDYSNADTDFRLIKIAFTQIEIPKSGLMSGQLASIAKLLQSAENKHDFIAGVDNRFGPTWDRVMISMRDPPPNQFSLPADFRLSLIFIAAGSGLGIT